jgi:hypothetical protein
MNYKYSQKEEQISSCNIIKQGNKKQYQIFFRCFQRRNYPIVKEQHQQKAKVVFHPMIIMALQ